MAGLFHCFQVNQDFDLLWKVTLYVVMHIIPVLFRLHINSIGNSGIRSILCINQGMSCYIQF
jgi:hypothetical protein